MPQTNFRETSRQLVHIAVGTLALTLRWLTWWQAAILALGGVLFNLFLLPRLARPLFRPGDLDAPVRSGIAIYPLAVLALVLAFPHRLDVVAGAWGILAAGDGFATLVGAHVATPRLPWNRAKSTGGLAAFVVAGGAAAAGLMLWSAPDPVPGELALRIGAAIAAAIVAGFVETLPIRLNDNISVPAAAALVLWSASVLDPLVLQAAGPVVLARLAIAAGVNVAVAGAGWLAGTVTIPGAIAGAVIGIVIYAAAGPAAWAMLMAAFLGAVIATRAGFRRKLMLGIAEGRGGRRGPGNAIANTGVAAWAALIGTGLLNPVPATLALVAALVTAASDTVASEVGKAWGRRTFLLGALTPPKAVAPGTIGAVSIEGTVAGVLAAVALSSVAVLLGLVPRAAVLPIAAAATLASFAEGWMGARFEAPGFVNNDVLNFLNAAIGAGLAVIFWTWR